MTTSGPSPHFQDPAAEARSGRLQVGRLQRPGPDATRMLLIASSRLVACSAGDQRFDDRLADDIRTLSGRGLDLDVLGEPARVLAAIERNPSFWRMWRYDVLAVVLPGRARRTKADEVVEAVLAEASERSRIVLVDGVAGTDPQTATTRLQVDLDDRSGLEALATAMTAAAGTPARRRPAGFRVPVPDAATTRRLQEVVHIARQAFGTASARITLTGARELLVVAAEGAELGPAPRAGALCDRAARRPGPTVYEDTWDDPEVRDLDTTHGPDGIRFYAGHSLRSAAGEQIGALCVYDPEPRPAEPHDWTLLEDLAMLAEAELSLSA